MPKSAHRARIYSGTPRNLHRLAGVLRAGQLVAVPTETVYGLAANALDARACARIFAAKGRPASNPLIVHIPDRAHLDSLALPNDAARKLAAAFWPGPLTLVLTKLPHVPDIVSAGLPSVAVRVPAHPLFRRLLRLTGLPLAAPSANPFGYISPTTAEHVRAGLGTKIGHILDGGACPVGLESTIVDVRNPAKPRLLRPGAITRTQIEQTLGVKVALGTRPGSVHTPQLAPGLLKRHYSPRTPVTLHPRLVAADALHGPSRDAWIFLARPTGPRRANIFWFDTRGDLRGVARRLFSTLRHLDAAGFRRLHVELAPDLDGLAHAINDRLTRAAAHS